ncbi:MAG: hypothetical protein KA715_04940 [Xanthomonadaceae bacterium]|nr:hypothetical protein [Xanthomonadaceae bacterium]
MKSYLIPALFALFFITICNGAADEVTNRELARTYANFYLRQKDFKQAQSSLASHLESDPADTEAWNLMGLAAMEIPDLSGAKQAFYRASQDEKSDSRGIYLYHFADALNRAGDVVKARDALKIAAQYSQVKDSAHRALELMKEKQPLPELFLSENARWNKSVAVSVGYDTNVMMAPNTTLANLTASDIASPNAMVMGKIGFVKPKFTREIEASLLGAFQYQTNPAAYQFTSIYGALSGEYRENGDEFSNFYWGIPVKADAALLNTSGFQVFNWNASFNPRFGHRMDALSRIELEPFAAYRWFLLASGSDTANDRTGFAFGAAATYRSFLGAWEYAVGVKFDRQFARGGNFSSYSYMIPISFVSPTVFWSSKLAIKSDVGVIDYPLASYTRRDFVINPQVALFRKFGQKWTGTFTVGSLINSSSLSSADYRKFYASAMAGMDF